MKTRTLICIIIAATMLSACEKELDFEYRDIDPITVIEGNVTNIGMSVKVMQTTAIDQPIDRTCYTDATVVITDETDGMEFALTPDEEGVYRSGEPGIPGHTYAIEVTRNGEHFAARSTMLQPAEILSYEMAWQRVPFGLGAIAKVLFLDPPQTRGDCYVVRVFHNGRLFTWGTASDMQAVNGVMPIVTMITIADSDGKLIDMDGNPIDETDEKVVKPGDEISVTIAPIPRTYYDYLVALMQGSNGPRMFQGDFCLGYFLAAPESRASLIFNPDDLPIIEM